MVCYRLGLEPVISRVMLSSEKFELVCHWSEFSRDALKQELWTRVLPSRTRTPNFCRNALQKPWDYGPPYTTRTSDFSGDGLNKH